MEKNTIVATGTEVSNSQAMHNQRAKEAEVKKGEMDRLKAAVAIHPALSDQAKTEGEGKPKEAPKQEAPKDDKPRGEDGKFKSKEENQGENWRKLTAEVDKAKATAAAALAELEKMRAAVEKPATPPKDPLQEARERALAKVPAEHHDYWNKVVLGAVEEMVRPVYAENRALKETIQKGQEEVSRAQNLAKTAREWGAENGLSAAEMQSVVERVFDEGLHPLLDTNPTAAFKAAHRGLDMAKRNEPTPEQKAEQKRAAKEAEEAENRARARAGGIDSSATGPGPAEGAPVDYRGLVQAARAKGDIREAARLLKMATMSAAGLDPEWLAGRKVILGPEG